MACTVKRINICTVLLDRSYFVPSWSSSPLAPFGVLVVMLVALWRHVLTSGLVLNPIRAILLLVFVVRSVDIFVEEYLIWYSRQLYLLWTLSAPFFYSIANKLASFNLMPFYFQRSSKWDPFIAIVGCRVIDRGVALISFWLVFPLCPLSLSVVSSGCTAVDCPLDWL